MNRKSVPTEFEKLLDQTEELVASDPSAEQVITLWTAGGHIRSFANHNVTSGNTADEAAFIKTLAESGDTKIQYAVCMWSDCALDVPSHSFRESLVEQNPANLETEFLLRGGEGFMVKSLRVMTGEKG